jgi:hypothetical protein
MIQRRIVLALAFAIAASPVSAQITTKTFVAERNFCQVEVRAGNTTNPSNHPVIYSGGLSGGQRTPSTQEPFLFAQREANPGVCGSGRGNWQQCSWSDCTLH